MGSQSSRQAICALTAAEALNQRRGFAYDASTTASELPLSITAYDTSGQTLQTEQVESAS